MKQDMRLSHVEIITFSERINWPRRVVFRVDKDSGRYQTALNSKEEEIT
jgi:hypothetical protein